MYIYHIKLKNLAILFTCKHYKFLKTIRCITKSPLPKSHTNKGGLKKNYH